MLKDLWLTLFEEGCYYVQDFRAMQVVPETI